MIVPNRNEEGGYNKNNLKKDYDRGFINGMEFAIEELETFKANLDCYDGLTDDYCETIGKIKEEFINYVIGCAIDWLDKETDMANTSAIDGQED